MSTFAADVLEAVRLARVVPIRTSRDASEPPRETLIWVVVDDAGRVLVRSVRGPRGRWYRDLMKHPYGALLIDDEPISFRAERADDPQRIDSCSRALAEKYPNAAESLASMLSPETLPTTLELHPA